MSTVSSSDIIFFFIHSVVFGSTGLHIDAPQDQTLHYEEFQSIFLFTILDKRGRTKPVIDCKSKAELLQRLLRKKHLSRSSAATKLNMQRETLHHPLRRSMFTGWDTDHCGAFSSEWFSTNHKGEEKHPVHLKKHNLHTTRRQKSKTSTLRANDALNHLRYKNAGNISRIGEYSLWKAALINWRRAIPSNERDHSPAVNEDRR